MNYIDYDVQSKCLHSSKEKSESTGKFATEYLRKIFLRVARISHFGQQMREHVFG